MTSCPTCHGLGRVYSCDWWPRCGCPAGATADGCNGASRPCPDCSGPARRDIPVWTRLAPPALDATPHEHTMDLALCAGAIVAVILIVIGLALS